jgi:hypothetical protein
VTVVKYRKDTRYGVAEACTHDRWIFKLKFGIIKKYFRRKMEAISAENIEEIYEKIKESDVIGIDEGQFVRNFKNLKLINQNFRELK